MARGIPIHSSVARNKAGQPYVVGPLWEVDVKRSAMSAQDHLDFTAADQNASQAEPFVGFGKDGEVLRVEWSSEGEAGIISRLAWTREAAHWASAENYSPPKGVGRFNRLQIGSGPLTMAWPRISGDWRIILPESWWCWLQSRLDEASLCALFDEETQADYCS